MADGGLLPVAELIQTVFNGATLGASYEINTYKAGTSVRLATYPTQADSLAETNANDNPTIANSSGRVSMWGSGTIAYKVVVKDAASGAVKTVDNVNFISGSTTLLSKTPSELQVGVYEDSSGSYRMTNAQTEYGYDFKIAATEVVLEAQFRQSAGTIFQKEVNAAAGDLATYGQWWTRDLTPNRPRFTDDAGEDFYIPVWSGYVTNVSDPPTQAEMVAAFGAAATTDQMRFVMLNDAEAGLKVYLCISDGTSWFYLLSTKGA